MKVYAVSLYNPVGLPPHIFKLGKYRLTKHGEDEVWERIDLDVVDIDGVPDMINVYAVLEARERDPFTQLTKKLIPYRATRDDVFDVYSLEKIREVILKEGWIYLHHPNKRHSSCFYASECRVVSEQLG